MEGHYVQGSWNQINPEAELPRLLEKLASRIVPGFDRAEDGLGLIELGLHSPALKTPSDLQSIGPQRCHSISISRPASRTGLLLGGEAERCFSNGQAIPFHSYSQPLPTATGGRVKPELGSDMRFESFKTWSGRLQNQMPEPQGRRRSLELQGDGDDSDRAALPVHRYFDALEGPELDILRPSEEAVLPEDKLWPFLLRFPISAFGICMGVGSQSILWKTLAQSPSTRFLRIRPEVNFLLWCTSLLLMAAISATYVLKAVFYFEAVRREFHHPVRVNFFFAPWIALLFLFLSLPQSVPLDLHGGAAWYVLMAPILCLELKIYGQWMSGGQRRLSKVANPSNHLSIVGNFVGALFGASVGLKEGPIFFFSVGLAHYAVLFVTLYQRLPTNEALPKELHPVFFLFVAAPSVASVAWARISGTFDYGSRIVYFIALFLYASLVVRVNFFRGFRFSLAWWAYTFPMTGAAIATIRYAAEVENPLTQSLSLALSAISTVTVALVLVSTVLHAFVLRDLFPNDISIAITKNPPRLRKAFPEASLPSEPTQERDDSVAIQVNER